MMFPHGETVTFLRAATTTDSYGNTRPDWSLTPTSTVVPNVGIEPRPSGEPFQDARNAVTSGFTLYMTPVDVSPQDRVVVRGVTYEVDGQPADWRNPFTGWVAGYVVQTKAVAG